ncbi:MAG TPA: HSP18 transcriptional regulator [Pseudonocardiaceae bacterium]|nr:HSP18 transcriptional regulator [Pseudonocardiaceae bacterium]
MADVRETLELVRSAVERDRAGQTADELLAALAALRELRLLIAAWEPELITAARQAGATWTQLAPALGVTSRQAAERRYLRLQPTETGETTGEARVQATRDQRAGQRAVDHWARANAAELRQLAGEISGLADLNPEARNRADEVHAALAGEATDLLGPLDDVRSHLVADHPGPAARITAIAEDAAAHRNSTLDSRRSHPADS